MAALGGRVRGRRAGAGALLLLVPLLVGACTGVRDLSEREGPPLAEGERALVLTQVDAALAERRYADAWNQAVEAGAGRERFEQIALAALEDDGGDAEDMFAALREKWGRLTPGAREQVKDLVRGRMTAGRWVDAAELAIAAADDPPTFAAAFQVYEQAPPRKAADVLETIQAARAEAAKAEGGK